MKKFLIFIFSLSFISIIFVAFFSDIIIKKTFENILSNNLNRSVKIGDFDVGYLSEEINLKKIEINNKDFPGKLLIIEQAFAKLDALSFYGETIIIDNIVLDGISVNYFFDITNKAKSNFTSLKRTLDNKARPNRKSDDKKFLIKQLDIKDIKVSASSSELNLNQTVKLRDMKFENLGNTKESKSYKTIAKEAIDKAYNEIKSKLASGVINQDAIKDKIKDKLKNKLQKLLK
ncbi:hypothetical protein OAT07_05980 [Candidatus Pelagibacter sp.]|nr:hypothetical protein [Candidatus Pelagibacter sp.]